MKRKLLCLMLILAIFISVFNFSITTHAVTTGQTKYVKVATSGSNLTVRSGPGVNYEKAYSLPNGYIVELITPEYISGWSKIKMTYRTNGANKVYIGYCSSEYLNPLSTSNYLLLLTSDDGFINIRSSAGGSVQTAYATNSVIEWDGGGLTSNYYRVYNAVSGTYGYVHKSVATVVDMYSSQYDFPALVSTISTTKLYTLRNAYTNNYAVLIGNELHTSASIPSLWKFSTEGNYYYRIKPSNNDTVAIAGTSNLVTEAVSSLSALQLWEIKSFGSGYHLFSVHSDRTQLMTDTGMGYIAQYGYSGLNDQIWYIEEYVLDSPSFSLSKTTPTKEPVSVTISFPNDATIKKYSIDNGPYYDYTESVTITSNCTIKAYCENAYGNKSQEVLFAVTNIDKTAPAAPTISATPDNNTTTESTSVSIIFPDDATIKLYSIDGKQTWLNYTQALDITENLTVYAKCSDAAGNESEITEYSVSNISVATPSPTITPTPIIQGTPIPAPTSRPQSSISSDNIGSTVCVKDTTNLYQLPDKESNAEKSISKDEQVNLIGFDDENNQWSIVKTTDKHIGYVDTSMLQGALLNLTQYDKLDWVSIYNSTNSLYLHQSFNNDVALEVYPACLGKEFRLIHIEDDKYVVITTDAEHKVGFISEIYERVAYADPTYYTNTKRIKYISENGATISPSLSSSTENQFYLPYGTEVTILFTDSESNKSIILSEDGYVGWVEEEKLTDTIENKNDLFLLSVADPTGLKLRQGPSTSFEVITDMPYGTQLVVIEKNVNGTPWHQVLITGTLSDIDNLIGYCSGNLTDVVAQGEAIVDQNSATAYAKTNQAVLLERPLSNAAVVEELSINDEITVLSYYIDNYYLVKSSSAIGYMSKDLFSYTVVADPAPSDATINQNTSLISYLDGPYMCTIPSGTNVKVISTDNNWTGIVVVNDNELLNLIGYVPTETVTVKNYNRFDEWSAESYTAYVQKDAVRIRTTPEIDSENICGQLNSNDSVTVLFNDYVSGWSIIKVNEGTYAGYLCYIYSEYIGTEQVTEENELSPKILSVDTSIADGYINLRKEMAFEQTNVIDAIPAVSSNELLVLMEFGENWKAVLVKSNDSTINGKVGFVYSGSGYTTIKYDGDNEWYESNQKEMLVGGNGGNINVRNEAIIDSSNQVTTVSYGDNVTVLFSTYSEEWTIIATEDHVGFISTQYIITYEEFVPSTTIQMVTTAGLNLRSSANITTDNKLLTMPEGSEVTVYIQDNDWAYVLYIDGGGNIHRGWCSCEYLTTNAQSDSPDTSTPSDTSGTIEFLSFEELYKEGETRYVYCYDNEINVRPQDDGSGEPVKTLRNNDTVTLLESLSFSAKKQWAKVRCADGTVGYVYACMLYSTPYQNNDNDKGAILSSSGRILSHKQDIINMAEKLGTSPIVILAVIMQECSGNGYYKGSIKTRFESGTYLEELNKKATGKSDINTFLKYYKAKTNDYLHEATSYESYKYICDNKSFMFWETFDRVSGRNINLLDEIERTKHLNKIAQISLASDDAMCRATSYGCFQLLGNSMFYFNVSESARSGYERMKTSNTEQFILAYRYIENIKRKVPTMARALEILKNDPTNLSALRDFGYYYNGRYSYGNELLEKINNYKNIW